MNKDVPQEKGFEEDIGRKGSENNASFEVFSKEKNKKRIMFNVCATKEIFAHQKEFDIAMTGNRRKRAGIQGILRLSKQKRPKILR